MKRRIGVITGSRAEYGHLKPLIDRILSDRDLDLRLLVTGTHLSPEFGLTYHEILGDGIRIDEKIEVTLSSDSPAGIAKSMGLTTIGFGEAFARLQPDIVVCIGDRFEIFSAIAAAHVSRIPIAHISGGDVTLGAFDDAFRHSITKMSHLHFTSTEASRKRVIQLGEDPRRVFRVGELSLDNIRRMKLLDRPELEKQIGFRFNSRNLLVTFHPVTLEENTSKTQFQALLNVLATLRETNLIMTKTNSDTGGRIINEMIDDFARRNKDRCVAFASMGHRNFLSALRHVDAIVGNSSSGIFEAASFRIGTINIGDRQSGRLKNESVIDCVPQEHDIRRALDVLYSREFRHRLRRVKNIYGDGNASARINRILKSHDLEEIVKKKFHDIPFST